ncbi:MAG: biopolymer transporter, partial [Microcystis panniformis WG22]|nr:biopolymer transporter [Microcystis panniformis WG22]
NLEIFDRGGEISPSLPPINSSPSR